MNRIAVVTASINWERAEPAVRSWFTRAQEPLDIYVVMQGRQQRDWEIVNRGGQSTFYGYHHRTILGVVPAFNLGVQRALNDGHPIIACFHDDLEIQQDNWDEIVWHHFMRDLTAGLAGFGGAKGLGEDGIYEHDYTPMDLVRKDFRSNMRDAEVHGTRTTEVQQVACLDGFSQIGRSWFWRGVSFEEATARLFGSYVPGVVSRPPSVATAPTPRLQTASHTFAVVHNLFEAMAAVGVVHHAYDAALGAFAHSLGYTTWLLPIACHHHGGLTAVADPRYQQWADDFTWHDIITGEEIRGDAGYWHQAHRLVYEMFRGVLPIRVD